MVLKRKEYMIRLYIYSTMNKQYVERVQNSKSLLDKG